MSAMRGLASTCSSISGWSARNWPSRGSSQCEAKIGTAETRNRRLPEDCRASARARSPKAWPVVAASARAGRRQHDAARPALEQLGAQRALEAGDAMADGRRRDVQRLGRRLERAGARRELEGLQREQIAGRETYLVLRRGHGLPDRARPARS